MGAREGRVGHEGVGRGGGQEKVGWDKRVWGGHEGVGQEGVGHGGCEGATVDKRERQQGASKE